MDNLSLEGLIEILEKHLKKLSSQSEQETLYYSILDSLIVNLKNGNYQDEKLARELSSLGFADLAREVRRGLNV